MFLRKLEVLAADIAAMINRKQQETWDYEALQTINKQIDQLLAEAMGRLDHLKAELTLRSELQQILQKAGLEGKASAQMLWDDQMNFYLNWMGKAQAYFSDETDTYVSFSLTVIELLFLLRLLMEEGVLKTETLQPVFLFISKYAGTQQQRVLSFSSLQKKYSTHHQSARNQVRKLLLQMIARIDQYNKTEK